LGPICLSTNRIGVCRQGLDCKLIAIIEEVTEGDAVAYIQRYARAYTGYCFHRHPASPTAGRHQLQSEVIASDKQLEGRFELEKVLAHEPAGQAIAASHFFDLRLIPLPPLLRLLCL
jgi:hypothetical protein